MAKQIQRQRKQDRREDISGHVLLKENVKKGSTVMDGKSESVGLEPARYAGCSYDEVGVGTCLKALLPRGKRANQACN
jgi:hypothetical protein